MSRSRFDPSFAELPGFLPIFPLSGVLMLPGGQLPLNIFEPRYLDMVRDALAWPRLIGMIQPQEEGREEVFRTGCAGRVIAFGETGDGRYLITLSGLIRFDIKEEPPRGALAYRRVVPEWGRWRANLDLPPPLEEFEAQFDRPRLIAALKPFFARHGINVDWSAVAATDGAQLITTCAMISPLGVREKQALLEARDTGERARLLTTLVEMAMLEETDIQS